MAAVSKTWFQSRHRRRRSRNPGSVIQLGFNKRHPQQNVVSKAVIAVVDTFIIKMWSYNNVSAVVNRQATPQHRRQSRNPAAKPGLVIPLAPKLESKHGSVILPAIKAVATWRLGETTGDQGGDNKLLEYDC